MENRFSSWTVKIMMASASLLMAFILLGMSTYAWFSVSTAPEVHKVRVAMETTKSFEIAKRVSNEQPGKSSTNDLDKGDETWGQTVDFESAYEDGDDFKDIKWPATSDGTSGESGGLMIAEIDEETCRTKGLVAASYDEDQELESGITYYTYDNPITNEKDVCGIVYNVWLRTNTTGNVTATISEYTDKDGSEVEKGDSKLRIMIALGDEGDRTYYSAEDTGSDEVTVDCGTLEASNEGTPCQIIVYMFGGDTDSDSYENGIESIHVGEDHVAETETYFTVKFTNDAVPTDND